MLSAFSMPAMLDTVVKYQIGELLLVPPILIRMVRDKIVDEYDLSCVKRFSSGGKSFRLSLLIASLVTKIRDEGYKGLN